MRLQLLYSTFQDDAVAVMRNHVERIHKKDYPHGLSREDALKDIREK